MEDTRTSSLEALLNPRSIAIIGASRKPSTIGNKLFHNLLQEEFTGVVYPVNPNSEAVASVKAYKSVLDIPGEVDLAVIITPAGSVPAVMEDCGKKGVKVVIVISAGFAEMGGDGIQAQGELLNIAEKYNMRMLGPNCMGVINTDTEINMNATFSSVFPPEGNIGMSTQSGALGLAILEYAQELNIGLSTFVSIGNRADISSNDLLEYWKDDPHTDVILLYLESFGNPRNFASIARTLTPTKPVLVVKSGRTAAGSKAAASHTGALVTAEVASEALFAQTGMIRVETLEELFDTANLLCNQPVPSGRNIAILTNGGGPGIMTADACADRGLLLPNLSEKTIEALKQILPSRASFANPIDMTAEASGPQYRRSLEILAEDENIDIVIVIFIPPIVTDPEAVAAAIRENTSLYYEKHKTLVASFMGSRGSNISQGPEAKFVVPSYAFPESTAAVLANACGYADWLKRPRGDKPEFADIKKDAARQLISQALEGKGDEKTWLDPDSVSKLLKYYGVRLPKSEEATSADDAAAKAEKIGFPVVVKLSSPTITHKTDVGGVELNLRTRDEVRLAYYSIENRLKSIGRADEMTGVTIQQMISDGVEIIIGMTEDPSFGPLMAFGLGGVQAELFRDVTSRICPLSDIDAQEMVRSVKSYQLLTGWRGSKQADIAAVEELLLRISAMIEDLPEIAEMDLNPIKVLEKGKKYVVVDARILLQKV